MDSVKEIINKIIKRVNLLENDLGCHTGQIDTINKDIKKLYGTICTHDGRIAALTNPDPSYQYPNAPPPPAKVLLGEIDALHANIKARDNQIESLKQENKVLARLVADSKKAEEQRVKDDTELRKSYTLVHNNLLKVLQNEAIWGRTSMERLFQIAASPTYTTPSEYKITIIDLWNRNPSLRADPHDYYPRSAANTAKYSF